MKVIVFQYGKQVANGEYIGKQGNFHAIRITDGELKHQYPFNLPAPPPYLAPAEDVRVAEEKITPDVVELIRQLNNIQGEYAVAWYKALTKALMESIAELEVSEKARNEAFKRALELAHDELR